MKPDKSACEVLREAQLHPLPRMLARPLLRPVQQADVLSVAALSLADSAGEAFLAVSNTMDALCEQAREQAYAEGLAQGREAGFVIGEEAGFAAGEAAGMAAATNANRACKEQLAQLLQSVSMQVTQRIEQAEEDMIALAFKIVCRIVGEAAISRAALQHMFRQALGKLPACPLVAVRSHPHDLATLQDDVAFNAEFDRAGSRVQWIADAAIQTGGCLLETATGSLDARLETQMQQLRDTLLQTRAARTQGDAAC